MKSTNRLHLYFCPFYHFYHPLKNPSKNLPAAFATLLVHYPPIAYPPFLYPPLSHTHRSLAPFLYPPLSLPTTPRTASIGVGARTIRIGKQPSFRALLQRQNAHASKGVACAKTVKWGTVWYDSGTAKQTITSVPNSIGNNRQANKTVSYQLVPDLYRSTTTKTSLALRTQSTAEEYALIESNKPWTHPNHSSDNTYHWWSWTSGQRRFRSQCRRSAQPPSAAAHATRAHRPPPA